ncbi:hypothetical protein BH23CHL5_BH23CHL5_14240 [soil metagenome]
MTGKVTASWQRIALIGFSGSGKTTIARLLGQRLGWSVCDLDEQIEAHFKMTIPEVFEQHGESAFREVERILLRNALDRSHVILATGGGAAAQNDAWSPHYLGDPTTLTIALDVRPETTLQRLTDQQRKEGFSVVRPMIAGDNPLDRISALKQARQNAYDRALITLPVDRTKPDQVAADIELLLRPETAADIPAVSLSAPGGVSRIYVQPGLLAESGTLTSAAYPNARRAWIISDINVAPHHAPAVQNALAVAGVSPTLIEVPSGESSKSLEQTGRLYDQLLEGGVERSDVIVALGGGVVGDLAGFVAATVLRGVGLVQIPTTLLAMVDSSVGGKTGINHAAGKNLIGSFYQPPVVLIDPETLGTLPPRELNQGWAEVIKHAAIQPSTPHGHRADLIDFLERNASQARALQNPVLSYLIRRNVELKSRVVEADERELGVRKLLNFGHTLGHAIEASTYEHLHGEAVALGMRAAIAISTEVNPSSGSRGERITALLDRFELPATTTIDVELVLHLTRSDKKRSHGSLRWILLDDCDGVGVRTDIEESIVRKALKTIDTVAK